MIKKYVGVLTAASILMTVSCGDTTKIERSTERKQCKQDPKDERCEHFNILSLDAAAYQGFITAKTIDFMEHTAYFSGKAQFGECFPTRDSEKVSMVELYDVIAGSETGALIAGSLVIPQEESSDSIYLNKHWAEDAVKHFEQNSGELYSSQNLKWYTNLIIVIIFVILDLLLAVYLTKKCLDPKRKQGQIIVDLQLLLDQQRDCIQKKSETNVSDKALHQKEITNLQEKMIERRERLDNLFLKETNLDLKQLKIEIETVNGGKNFMVDQDKEELKLIDDKAQIKLVECQAKIDDKFKEIKMKRIIKYVVLLAVVGLSILFSELAIIPFAEYLTVYHSKKLRNLQENLIPKGFDIDKILTYDVLFPAWNLDKTEPVLFSKVSKSKLKDIIPQVNMDDMVFASQSNPLYFEDATLKWKDEASKDIEQSFFGGNILAGSPALYTVFQQNELNDIPTDKMTLTSVGSLAYNPNRIPDQVGPLEWASRLLSLTGPVKQMTQDYIVDYIIKNGSKDYVKIELQTFEASSFWDFFTSVRNFAKIKNNTKNLLQSQRLAIQKVMNKKVYQNFKELCKPSCNTHCPNDAIE